MKNCGLGARWVKSRSIVGCDLQHHVNCADEDHFVLVHSLQPRHLLVHSFQFRHRHSIVMTLHMHVGPGLESFVRKTSFVFIVAILR